MVQMTLSTNYHPKHQHHEQVEHDEEGFDLWWFFPCIKKDKKRKPGE